MEKFQFYLTAFELLVGIVIAFTAFNEKVFWKDFKTFFVGLWHIIKVNGTALYNIYTEMSKYVTAAIENEMLQNVLYWLLLIVVYLGEYVKLVLSMNLLGLWLIGTIIIIAVCIYVTDCMKYRR